MNQLSGVWRNIISGCSILLNLALIVCMMIFLIRYTKKRKQQNRSIFLSWAYGLEGIFTVQMLYSILWIIVDSFSLTQRTYAWYWFFYQNALLSTILWLFFIVVLGWVPIVLGTVLYFKETHHTDRKPTRKDRLLLVAVPVFSILRFLAYCLIEQAMGGFQLI